MDALASLFQQNVPRYTSYPTAPHFSEAVDAAVYAGWLKALDPAAPVSLYLHVPFCEELCLYCGCNTTVVRKREPRELYAQMMEAEIEMVAGLIGHRQKVCHIHWGGGTPTALPADSMIRISHAIHAHFDVQPGAEIAVEIDPRHLEADRLGALAAIGVTRASLGVQDFDPQVQKAIGRIQSFERTACCAAQLRDAGVKSVNLDLIYGLPCQTAAGAAETARQALALGADRVAVFGYAHVPWMKPHQKLLPEDKLPDASARLAQRAAIDAVFAEAGFRRVGLDHYALPGDAMIQAAEHGALRRNFQGYTDDPADALIGIGASSIGSLPQGYAQNHTRVPQYTAAIRAGTLPVARGVVLTDEDRLRRDVIDSLMCDLQVNLPEVARRHGSDPAELVRLVEGLEQLREGGLVAWDGEALAVTEAGRPFVRTVASAFDAYLKPSGRRHASAV
jgi:oxygen-independent coproporphyrinogen III oxidase